MHRHLPKRAVLAALAVAALATPSIRAAERITLRNGFEVDCLRRETSGTRTRLYLVPSAGAPASPAESASYMEIASDAILRVEPLADPLPVVSAPVQSPSAPPGIPELLASAGSRHNIDADLLAAVVHAESAGNTHAVSRTGARGLMQLMPGTAADLGVHDSFAPDQNIAGGSAYLDALLTRYHDDIALALAAYNAGPAAVDRYHGIPPYAETRAYVARIIREFNRRKLAALSLNKAPAARQP